MGDITPAIYYAVPLTQCENREFEKFSGSAVVYKHEDRRSQFFCLLRDDPMEFEGAEGVRHELVKRGMPLKYARLLSYKIHHILVS